VTAGSGRSFGQAGHPLGISKNQQTLPLKSIISTEIYPKERKVKPREKEKKKEKKRNKSQRVEFVVYD
jgi:hypothetical protein